MTGKNVSGSVRNAEDRRMYGLAVFLFMCAAALAGFDLVSVIRGTVDMHVHWPFLVAAVLAAFGAMIMKILRLGPQHPVRSEMDGQVDRSSYQHPDNWPKGRINAPPGTSD